MLVIGYNPMLITTEFRCNLETLIFQTLFIFFLSCFKIIFRISKIWLRISITSFLLILSPILLLL